MEVEDTPLLIPDLRLEAKMRAEVSHFVFFEGCGFIVL